ncbi:microtubule associated protein-domain-containing protein [Mycena rosella]|uniref:Microtubule associated protein-domain-containing protein n=1 Tax=Mycena rosella TaxID=1033263 RepID=A0AAD7GUE7_MYCRO|nr:microtubule associated protein-domain-containing protein [Mycena rosella]
MGSPLTLTTLLNSLHTHLQSQTQLLPTLHGQLGLPPSALEDELKMLQQQLMRSVEAQIDLRRKEVDGWMEKCEAIEAECVNYAKALGGNVKATGSSLGELRKEKVLPVRYEMVTEYQEKLRQLYHTKLEQLTTLANRLNALSRTLGPEFYAQDLVDEAEYRDVSPERFSKLEKELVRGKGEVAKRLAHLSETFIQIDWLYTELGMAPPIPDDSCSPSTSMLSRSSISSDPFLTPSATEAAHYHILADFIDQAASLAEDTPPRLEVEPTPALISWALDLRASLEDTKRRRETHIQAMYDQLEGLWKRLGVAEADMDAFVETHRGSTEETVGEYEEELERMLELKRERMGTFVGSAREEIEKLWDELMVGDEERREWGPFFDEEHTEELLIIHEDEIKRLKEEKRMKAPLLAGIKRYFDICEEEKELAAAASDQTRLLGRGSRDPGRLLREEKMRKRVSKEKPRLEQDLLTTIPAWEHEAGRPFLVHGHSILHILMQTVSAADQENAGTNNQNSGKRKPSPSGSRATSVPARATTPTPLHSYAPRTGVVTPAIRPAPANSNSHPSKRARTDATTPSYTFNKAAVLGAHQGGNSNGNGLTRTASPSKIPLSRTTPTGLPMPTRAAAPAPPFGIPKPTQAQYHALGHGRGPTTGYGGARSASVSVSTASISSAGSSYGRYASGGAVPTGLAAKAGRARRESFKPRASVDAEAQWDLGSSHAAGVRWGFEGVMVKEEENEDY